MNARDLTNHLADLLRRERHAMADFLLALADFDQQRGWMELGHPSLFSFLHRELGLSKGAAYYRKIAADLVRSFPEVVEPLRDGRLCITSVVELAKVLTPENRSEVVPRFFHRSKQEAKAVSAELRPAEAAPHRDVLTMPVRLLEPSRLRGADARVEVRGPALDRARDAVHPDEPRPDRGQVAVHPGEPAVLTAKAAAAPSMSLAAVRDSAEPLTADLRRLHVTVSRRFLAKLDAARDALSHARPGATTEGVLEAALDLLLAQRAKRNGLVEKPRTIARPVKSDAIPAAVKREVWRRAGGRCEWPLDSGGVCGSPLRLEHDHVTPRALGGPSTVANLRVTCRFHNQLAAQQEFGEEWMSRFKRRASPRRAGRHAR
jgi:hypothetical protein